MCARTQRNQLFLRRPGACWPQQQLMILKPVRAGVSRGKEELVKRGGHPPVLPPDLGNDIHAPHHLILHERATWFMWTPPEPYLALCFLLRAWDHTVASLPVSFSQDYVSISGSCCLPACDRLCNAISPTSPPGMARPPHPLHPHALERSEHPTILDVLTSMISTL
jgi:hypothetical protein